MKRSIRLTTLIILFPLITLLLYGGLSYLFFFYTKKSDIKKEIARYNIILLDAQKSNLIEKVENLTRFIRFYNYRTNDKIKNDVKKYVYLISNTINSFYENSKNNLPQDELKRVILNTLKSVGDKNGNKYIFVLNKNGKILLHPDKNLIGKDATKIRDINGKYFIKEFLSVADEKREGFIDYYWYKPNSKEHKMYYKIGFIKSLGIYNWYIGSGEYQKDILNNIKEDTLAYVKHNANFENGYFFISNSKNEIIFHPYKSKSGEVNELLQEGIYEDDEKIAYTAYVAEYDWYITAVKSMKAVKKEIKVLAKENEKKIAKDTQTNLYIVALTWIVSILLSLYLSTIVNNKLKNYEKQLEESNEKLIFQSRQALIGELFSMIAHQWRQPINKIASIIAPYRFILEDEEIDKKELDRDFQKIEDSVEYMSYTIDDFRTFYKPKNSKELTNLKTIIEKSIDFLSGSIRKKDIKVVKHLKDIKIMSYSNELLQVLINIIKNATDAVEQRGVITITVEDRDNQAIIYIEDNGLGIKDEDIDKIFDPYFSTKEDSMGLGLYMCRLIIQKHLKGNIEVKRLEKGTMFIIYLSK